MVGAAASLLILTGCVTIQVGPDGGRDDDGRTAETVDCDVTQNVALTQPDTDYTVTGSCRELTIEGTRLTVTANTVLELTVRGDDNTVTLDSFKQLTIEGQRNAIETLDGGTVAIRGNENSLDSADYLGEVTVSGQRNTVTADGFIASIEENGSSD